jgi:hypothetical protein
MEGAMPTAFELNYPGVSLEQYDQVIEAMGFTPGGAHVPGCLFHWAAKTDDGIRVVDVWESKEQFERFAEEKIGPLTEQAGFGPPPAITSYEVHNHLSTQ